MEASILGEALPYDGKITGIGSYKYVSVEGYNDFHRKTVENFEDFWASKARELKWFKPFEKVVEPGERPYVYRWFTSGLINISYLAVDISVKTKKNKVAYMWEGEPVDESGRPKEVRKLTYYDLYREVNRVSYMMKTFLG